MTSSSLWRLSWLGLLGFVGGCMPPSWGANALLHPGRRIATTSPSQKFEALDLAGDGVVLKGWYFRSERPRRGTFIYLHGVGDSRVSSISLARHLTGRGFDVLAYDSRAHGESSGDACTYGFHERRDLRHALDKLATSPVMLLGTSMGAAVALQTAAEDKRIAATVAIATFSDLRTAAFERAPFFASRGNVEAALSMAETRGAFRIDEVSPLLAAQRIQSPVFVIHGAKDRETPSDHSRRVFEALRGPNKRLLIVPDAGHGDVLRAQTWKEIDLWIDSIIPATPR
jgi:uncharacterized protein